MKVWVLFLIAISLSMDAFSLALSLGTMSFSRKKMLLLSLIVGVFHFIMPILGSFFGQYFISLLHFNSHLITAIIFLYIALQMFREVFENENDFFDMSLIGFCIFALGVSLDSFGVGFTISTNINNLLFCACIFALFSFSFTLLGLNLGKIMNRFLGRYACIIGGIVMVGLAIANFVNYYYLG